jgi:amino acid adenylation domain-containing protein
VIVQSAVMAALVTERFHGVAAQHHADVALRTPAGDTTYGELAGNARALARALAGRGLAGARIAIAASDHVTIVTALLGILEAGGIVVPLDPHAAPERWAAQLAKVRPSAFLVDAEARGRVAGEVLELAGGRLVTPGPAADPPRPLDPDGPCSIYFTSGSTGEPRAILGRLAGIDHHIAWEVDYLGAVACARGAIIHAPTYDAYLPDVLVPLCAGGIACAPAMRELDPAALCAWLVAERITLLHATPSLFRSLLAHPAARSLPALRAVLLAGEIVRSADVAAARDVLGTAVRLVNLYGPTEATLVKLHHEITEADATRPVPIGVPMPGVTVELIDGQIAITSPFGAHGYLDEPAVTAERWRGQQYLTGDYGAWNPDGTLAFHGRRDRQVKIFGARVDLDEVEALLCACDGIVEAAVVPTEDHVALLGYVVLAPATAISDVRRAAVARLTPAMRLARLTPLAALPRTASGKIDRRALEVHA